LQGADRLIKFHNSAWDELWTGDIKIEGDPQVQQMRHSTPYPITRFTPARHIRHRRWGYPV